MNPARRHEGGSPDREACLVVLDRHGRHVARRDLSLERAGGRSSVFEDVPPAAVYVPAGIDYRDHAATTPVELAIGTAPGDGRGRAAADRSGRMTREVRGQGTNQRFVRNILPETEPAESLLVVEVITPGGHWSSYPPHKHDTATEGEETALEETYYHRLNPPQGFAIQRVYTDDRSIDETITRRGRRRGHGAARLSSSGRAARL